MTNKITTLTYCAGYTLQEATLFTESYQKKNGGAWYHVRIKYARVNKWAYTNKIAYMWSDFVTPLIEALAKAKDATLGADELKALGYDMDGLWEALIVVPSGATIRTKNNELKTVSDRWLLVFGDTKEQAEAEAIKAADRLYQEIEDAKPKELNIKPLISSELKPLVEQGNPLDE